MLFAESRKQGTARRCTLNSELARGGKNVSRLSPDLDLKCRHDPPS
jgi:hypothetical protein